MTSDKRNGLDLVRPSDCRIGASGELLSDAFDGKGLRSAVLMPVGRFLGLVGSFFAPLLRILLSIMGGGYKKGAGAIGVVASTVWRGYHWVVAKFSAFIGWAPMVVAPTVVIPGAKAAVPPFASPVPVRAGTTLPVHEHVSHADLEGAIQVILENATSKGDFGLPKNSGALASLLLNPRVSNDDAACRLLQAAFPAIDFLHSDSRALLAAAISLTSCFGGPGRLPQAAAQAWKMLNPVMFEHEFAAQLLRITADVAERQANREMIITFEQYEIDLIDFFFETLSPSTHAHLLGEVLDMRVLSNRRVGLLRRIPYRMKKLVETNPPGVLISVVAMEEFLDRISHSHPYPPIAEAAGEAMEHVKKLVDTLTAASVSPVSDSPASDSPASVSQASVSQASVAPQLPAPDKGAALGCIFDGIKPPSSPHSVPSHTVAAAPYSSVSMARRAPMVMTGVHAPQTPMVSVTPVLGAGWAPLVAGMPHDSSSEKRRTAVLRLLAGGDLNEIAGSFAINPAELLRWRDDFLEAGSSALKEEGVVTVIQLKSKLAEVLETAKTLEIALDNAMSRPAEMRLDLPSVGGGDGQSVI